MIEGRSKGDGKAMARLALGIGMGVMLPLVLLIGLRNGEPIPWVGVTITILGVLTVAMAFLKKS